jgi:hypothetical protein
MIQESGSSKPQGSSLVVRLMNLLTVAKIERNNPLPCQEMNDKAGQVSLMRYFPHFIHLLGFVHGPARTGRRLKRAHQ